jgi:hypothetical protein
MKQFIMSLAISTLLIGSALFADCDCTCSSIYIPRSTGIVPLETGFMSCGHQKDMEKCYGGIDLSFEYNRSFDNDRIACDLFGSNTLLFQGSNVLNRNSHGLVADYFGLAPDTNIALDLNPLIQNFSFHAQTFLGLDKWAHGLYVILNTTVTGQKRELFHNYYNDTTITPLSDTPFNYGYMGENLVTPLASVQEALQGQTRFGDMTTPRCYGNFDFCPETTWGFADVQAMLGWDFLRKEKYYLGAYLIAIAPTGDKVNHEYAQTIFGNLVGNGKHWELGGGISGQTELWHRGTEKNITAYIDGYLTHIFSHRTTRSFDLTNNGCLSRYMLLKGYNQSTEADEQIVGTYDYNGNLIYAINKSTQELKTSIPVKVDASLKFVFHNNHWDFGIGGNVYATAKEHGKCMACATTDCCCFTPTAATWGVKGCTNVYYWTGVVQDESDGAINPNTILPAYLNASQSNATMYSACADNTIDNAFTLSTYTIISGIETPNNHSTITNTVRGWVEGDIIPFADETLIPGNSINGNLYRAATIRLLDDTVNGYTVYEAPIESVNPAVITCPASYNLCSGLSSSQFSGTIFGTLDYTWVDCNWTPYIGVGGKGEFAPSNKPGTLNQWGVWVKGGISY